MIVLGGKMSPAIYRMCEGKRYELTASFSSKGKAKRKADRLRKRGFLARIVKISERPNTQWGVFWHG